MGDFCILKQICLARGLIDAVVWAKGKLKRCFFAVIDDAKNLDIMNVVLSFKKSIGDY